MFANYPQMMPAGSHNRIRSVNIHYAYFIAGFSFFDKEGALLYKIGDTDEDLNVDTVVLEENEVIVGVVAKLYPGW